ncbi:hypothetical protein KAJ27_00520, partial [bacterium]|nr:hypothetical protein [bacterium]
KLIFIIQLILIMAPVGVLGKAPNNPNLTLQKTSILEFDHFDVNNIKSWIGNNGHIVSYIPAGDAGLEWPQGSGLTAVFASGLWVAGYVENAEGQLEIRSAAAEFTSEFSPGSIDYDPSTPEISGIPASSKNPKFQVYTINSGDSSDPSDLDHYNREYASWPASDGAPAHDGDYFTDINGNGVYDSGEPYEDFSNDGCYTAPDGKLETGVDPPEMIADQMHWFVFNDANAATHENLFNTRKHPVKHIC